MTARIVTRADWPKRTCAHGPDCDGARVGLDGHCWLHLEGDEMQAAYAMLAEERDLDLRGVAVSDYLLRQILRHLGGPSRQVEIRSARCEKASFEGIASFDHVVFIEDARFNGATFGLGVTFANTRFTCPVDFSDARFGTAAPAGSAQTSFTDTVFALGARFDRAVFAGQLTVTQALLTGSASFDHAQLDTAQLSFASQDPEGAVTVSLAGASAGSELTLSLQAPAAVLSLDRLQAAGPADIRAQAAEVRCEDAAFSGQARFLLACGPRMWLTDTVFSEPSTVESWLQPGTVRDSLESGDQQVALRSLRGVDAEHLTLSDVDLSQCLIYGLRRPDELRLAGRWRLAPVPRRVYYRWKVLPWRWTSREALYEECLWRRLSATSALGWREIKVPPEDADAAANPPRPAALAVLYRQLRKSVEEAKNEPGAADLYYGEMEMRRLSTGPRAERWLLAVYWLVSGYGLRASRSMLVLGALVLGSALALQRTGFPGPVPGYPDCLLYAGGSVISLDLSGHLPAHPTDWGQLTHMLLRIIGPVLLGLGALAMRGRVKR